MGWRVWAWLCEGQGRHASLPASPSRTAWGLCPAGLLEVRQLRPTQPFLPPHLHLLQRRVIFIDAEGKFSVERLKELAWSRWGHT